MFQSKAFFRSYKRINSSHEKGSGICGRCDRHDYDQTFFSVLRSSSFFFSISIYPYCVELQKVFLTFFFFSFFLFGFKCQQNLLKMACAFKSIHAVWHALSNEYMQLIFLRLFFSFKNNNYIFYPGGGRRERGHFLF